MGNDFFFVIALAFRQGVCQMEVAESGGDLHELTDKPPPLVEKKRGRRKEIVNSIFNQLPI